MPGVRTYSRSKPESRRSRSKPRSFGRSAEDIANVIGIPVSEWEGNCTVIAQAVLEAGLVPNGKLQYGIWWGKISSDTIFGGRPFTHHSWIKLPDGTIVDPTRWVFEGTEPYIFVGKNAGEYDFGSNRLRRETMSRFPIPAYEPGQDVTLPLCENTQRSIQTLFDNKDTRISRSQVGWLANRAFDLFNRDTTKEIYRAMVNAGYRAFIPIDNRNEILGVNQ